MLSQFKKIIPKPLIKLYHYLLAIAANFFYDSPSDKLIVIGVTGTDGKTTTVQMIYEILKAASYKVSMISSIKAVIGSKVYDTGFHVTTPSPWQVQRFLRKAVDLGGQYFVLEATSHGLDQNRLAFVKFNQKSFSGKIYLGNFNPGQF